MTPDSRACTKCGEKKQLRHFSKAPRGKYGRKATCKECDAARAAENFVSRALPPGEVERRLQEARGDTKTCTKCSATKPRDQFSKSRDGKFGPVLKGSCKACDSDRARTSRMASWPDGVAPRRGYVKHGMEGTPTYNSWSSMIQRCTNPHAHNYKYWGGRGISVCERWLKFENFLEDMGERPEGLTLDRVDTHRDYGPSNCRWATHVEQARNRTNTKLTEADAVRIRNIQGRTQASIAEEFGVHQSVVSDIRSGKTWVI